MARLEWSRVIIVALIVASVASCGAPPRDPARTDDDDDAQFLPTCGNGRIDPGESCDDGNIANGDACESNCTLPACGNGVLDPGEECEYVGPARQLACQPDCTLPRLLCGNGVLDRGETCDDGNNTDGDGCSARCTPSAMLFVKASNPMDGALFGGAVVLSADGATLAVGAVAEDSGASGVDGDQADHSTPGAGAVYVYTRSGATWRQQAYLKASNPFPSAYFGGAVALSSDGSILAVGAIGEASAAKGIDGDPFDRSASFAGAVYLFEREGAAWRQVAYVKASNTAAYTQFGLTVALTGDGHTLAVGSPYESGATRGIGGDDSVQTAPAAGAVYLYRRDAGAWRQDAYIKASNAEGGDGFGFHVALSRDGSTLAVGATHEASIATGVDGDQLSNLRPTSGAVYVFARSAASWAQQAYLKASNTGASDLFGTSVALTADGSLLAVGAIGEDSAARGVNGDQLDNRLLEAGAAYVFERVGTKWRHQAYLKPSNTMLTEEFGWSVAWTPEGAELVVGAASEDSSATGFNGNQDNDDELASGAVYVFRHRGADWWQQAYVKASNTAAGGGFGWGVSLADDGTLAVGGLGDFSGASGVGGDQTDKSAPAAGAVYLIE